MDGAAVVSGIARGDVIGDSDLVVGSTFGDVVVVLGGFSLLVVVVRGSNPNEVAQASTSRAFKLTVSRAHMN